MNKLISCTLAVASVGFLASTSSAAIITPGNGTLMAGNTNANVNGTLLDTLTVPVAAGSITATLTTQVYLNDTFNPFTPGPNGVLTFVYTLANGAASDALERFNVNNFSSFQTDVEYLATATGIPSTASRSSFAQDGGTLVGFNFQDAFGSPSLQPGQTAVLIVHTDASGYAPDTARVIDGAVATVDAFGPAPGSGRTPEPASLSIMAVGGLLMLRRRK